MISFWVDLSKRVDTVSEEDVKNISRRLQPINSELGEVKGKKIEDRFVRKAIVLLAMVQEEQKILSREYQGMSSGGLVVELQNPSFKNRNPNFVNFKREYVRLRETKKALLCLISNFVHQENPDGFGDFAIRRDWRVVFSPCLSMEVLDLIQ